MSRSVLPALIFLVSLVSPLFAGAPTQPFEADEHTTLLCHFDGPESVVDPAWINAGHGRLEGEPTFVEGRFGKGLLLADKTHVRFPGTPGTLPVGQGTFECYLKPRETWAGYATLLLGGGTFWDRWGVNQFDIRFKGSDMLVVGIKGRENGLQVKAELPDWPTDIWRHVAICWDLPEGRAAVYIDGELAGETDGDAVTMKPGTKGFGLNATSGRPPLNAVIDELRISNVWRTPGSDHYRGTPVQAQSPDRTLNDDASFENEPLGRDGNYTQPWNVLEAPAGASVERSGSNPHVGKACLAITQPTPDPKKTLVSGRPFWTPASPGRTYTFSAWLRSEAENIEARLVLVTDERHSRQVVVSPTAQWAKYELAFTVPEEGGTLIWPQIENWGGGTLYVDDAELREGGEAVEPREFVVDVAAPRGPIADLHAGADIAIINWQSATLDAKTLAAMRTAGIRRVRYSIFCPALGLATGGPDALDWTMVDRHFRMFQSAGITPVLCFHFTPAWLSEDGENGGVPKDYDAWGKLVGEVVRHVNVENDYGVRYFEVWNEPDLDFWKGDTQQLCELYKVFVESVRGVDPKAKVGGPGVSGGHKGWRGHDLYPLVKQFIAYVGRENLPLDFLSFHLYDMDPSQTKHMVQEFRGFLAPWPKLVGAEMYVSEWNASAGTTGPKLDGASNAAYAAAMLQAMQAGSCDLATFFNFKDPAWPHPGKVFFNELGLVTVDATPKAVCNTMQLFSRLQPTRLLTTGGTWSTGALATRGDDGLAILVHNDLGHAAQRVVTLQNLPAGTWTLRRTLIDKEHSNALEAYRRLPPKKYGPLPDFADGTWGEVLPAAELVDASADGWQKWDAGYRSKAPAGCSKKIAGTKQAGPTLDWTVNLPAAGDYRVWVKADCTYYGGVLELLDDSDVIASADTYINGLDMRWIGWTLEGRPAGVQTLSLRLSQAGGAMDHPRRNAAVDTIVITSDDAFRPAPVLTGTEGQAGVDLGEFAELDVVDEKQITADGPVQLPLVLPGHSVQLIELRPAKHK